MLRVATQKKMYSGLIFVTVGYSVLTVMMEGPRLTEDSIVCMESNKLPTNTTSGFPFRIEITVGPLVVAIIKHT